MTLQDLFASIDIEAHTKKAVAEKDYKAGEADCKAGVFDKWYRYNRKDDGLAYNFGWLNANRTIQNDKVSFIQYDIYNFEQK